MSFVYLASPYSHPDPAIREARFAAACLAAGKLMQTGIAVFCPIAHSHPIGKLMAVERNHEFWLRQDLPILAASSRLFVLRLAGWQQSVGVAEEMARASDWHIPVEFLDEA